MKINNPIGIINIGDPFIIENEGEYYLYATTFNEGIGSIKGFNCWVSKDLVNWSKPYEAYRANERSFGYKDFWAPEVIKHNDKFIMHYSARMKENDSLRIGVAISDKPTGPFIDVYDKKPMFDFGYAAIDGHVFIDDDGKKYFYYDRDCSEHIYEDRNESHIYVCLLDETLTKIISEPQLVIKPEQEWEKSTGDWRWNEGAFVLKKDDEYYLMYSAGFFESPTYGIGYAKSKSPLGPFVKASENPIVRSKEGFFSGPGHNSVFKGKDNQLYCAYHVHVDMNNPSEKRQLFIDKLNFNKGKIIVNPTINGKEVI